MTCLEQPLCILFDPQDLNQTCIEMQKRLVDLVGKVQIEEITCEYRLNQACRVYDSIFLKSYFQLFGFKNVKKLNCRSIQML